MLLPRQQSLPADITGLTSFCGHVILLYHKQISNIKDIIIDWWNSFSIASPFVDQVPNITYCRILNFVFLFPQLEYVSNDVEAYLKKTTRDEAWLTDYSVRRNYSTPFRINSLTEDLSSQIYTVTNLIKVN